MRAITLAGAYLTFSFAAVGEIVLSGMDPEFGPPGTEVTLAGTGFDPGQTYSVTVGGTAAAVSEVTANSLRFTVPGGAGSGPVTVTVGDASFTHALSFTLTRLITVQLDPAANIPSSAYTVGSLYVDAAGTGPNYTVEVAIGEPTLVAASSADETMPALMGLVTDADGAVTLSAETTASTLVLLTPGLQTVDHGEAGARLAFLDGRSSVQSLAQAIQAALTTGNDYIGDAAVTTAQEAAIVDFLDNYTPAPQPAEPQFAARLQDDFANTTNQFISGYPRDLPIENLALLRKLVSSAVTNATDARGLPVLGIKVATSPNPASEPGLNFKANPLDWSAVLYELDPNDTNISSLAKVNALAHDTTTAYLRRNPRPLDRLHIKASPVFRILDVVGLVTDWLTGPIKPAFAQKEHLEVPVDRPGLYMVRAHSGAWFAPQDDLLDNLPDGHRESVRMAAVNIVLAVMDAGSIIAKGRLGGGDNKCLNSFVLSLNNTVDGVLLREANQNTINGNVILVLFLEASKSYVKDYFVKCVILDKDRRGISGTAKAMIAAINLAGKIASFGKLAERINALGNLQNFVAPQGTEAWIAQSVESSIAVVGNPWSPVITSFYPQAGYRGTVVRINGRHFSPVTNENLVTFGVLSTDPENPAEPARAEVLKATETALVVRVPEDAQTGIITVAVAGSGSSSSADLPEKFQVFTVYEDPIITHIEPAVPIVGKSMEIHGMHFAPMPDQQILDFSATTDVTPKVGNQQVLFVRAPNNTNANSVKVRIGERESNELAFTPVLPAVIEAGAVITVTSDLDNNTRDDAITLREAILLATGALSYDDLTESPIPRPSGQSYEKDFVTVTMLEDGSESRPGPGSLDQIVTAGFLVGAVFQVSSSLPPLGSFDSYSIEGIVDGGGLAGNGFHLNGERLSLTVTTVRNFGGHGVLVTGNDNALTGNDNTLSAAVEECSGDGIRFEGSARNNRITSVAISQCAGDGIRLADNARANLLERIRITDCANGVRMAGAGVWFNELSPNFADHFMNGNQQFGVLLDSGASFNHLIVWQAQSNGSGGIRIAGANTAGNRVESSTLAALPSRSGRVFDNGGPGIWISSPSNLLYGFNVAGNMGDGVLLEDSDCHDVTLWGIRAGYDTQTGAAYPNQGSGMRVRNGAHNLNIGLPEYDVQNGDSDISDARNYLGGNRDHGLLIEGAATRDITVTLSSAGWGVDWLTKEHSLPNGQHGIAVTNGANNVIIGGAYEAINVTIANQTNGAGIYFDGPNTSSNLVFGCHIGHFWNSTRRKGNRYGVHIANNAYANVIGERGSPYQVSFPDFVRNYDSRNVIQGNLEAGILLEAGGDPNKTSSPGETPTGGNVIQNNWIGGDSVVAEENRVGILIRQGAEANRIGGSNPEEANQINYNTHAGIQIDGAVITRPERASRIIGNELRRNGYRVTNPGDPLAETPDGTGISLINGASGHIIGGDNPGEANHVWENHVGIHVADSAANQILGNRIRRNKLGGIVLLGASENTVGPRNEITRNGTHSTHLGGVTLQSSANNTVVGNIVGFDESRRFATGDGNKPHGIGLFDSPMNLIGELSSDGRNYVSDNPDGVVIAGPGSIQNQVVNNYIGFSDLAGIFVGPNAQSGILITSGAAANTIGGQRPVQTANATTLVPAGNWIQRNGGDGVRVTGAGTVGNSILYNSISLHSAGLGIENVAGGNSELPPPIITAFDGTTVTGIVNANSVPDGSLVQIFSDNADEGQNFLSEAVVAGGAFQARIGLSALPKLNATVTHAISGSTSEFAPVTTTNLIGPGLEVLRVTDEPVERAIAVPANGQAVLAFKLRAIGGPVLVSFISVRSLGTVDEPSAIAGLYLYHDTEKDGAVGPDDRQLGDPKTFTTDNGNATISGFTATVEPGNDQQWLLIANLTDAAQDGQTIAFEIPTHFFVSSRGLFTGSAIVETGDFSIVSDTLLVSGSAQAGTFNSIRVEGDEIVIKWTGAGVLEEADEVTGPWSEITGATTPFRFPFDAAKKFYRLTVE
jgi:parallel beta-helix repeat protein